MTQFYRFCRDIFKFFFKVLYKHKVYGAKHIPKGRAIIAPNHISYFDPPLVGLSCPDDVHFLAKDTLFQQPILGTIIRNLNAFPVSGHVSDLKSIKAICNVLDQDQKVIIFPEGIRTYDGKLSHVKPGIALLSMRENAPIIPTFIHGTFEIWPRQNWLPKPWGKTICAFGTPIYPKKFKNLDKKAAQIAMGQEVRDSIERLRDWYLDGAHGSPP